MKRIPAFLFALLLSSSAWAQTIQPQSAASQYTNTAGLGVGVWGMSTLSSGTAYVPGDTITPTLPGTTTNSILGGAYNGSVFYVATTQVVSATVNAAGASCTGATATLTGTTGTGGAGAFFTATAPVVANAITNPVTITAGGDYRVNPTSIAAEPVTGSSCVGATLTLVMGVHFANVQNPGSYSVVPSKTMTATQGSTSGSGTGATFTVTFAPQAGFLLPPTNSPNFGAQNTNQAAYNMCVGYLCLNAVTSGVEDTAFGWEALNTLTTGNLDTAFGVHALGSITTGFGNTGVGVDAGRNVTTGFNNTIVGQGAIGGVSAAGVLRSTAIGQGSLAVLATGADFDTALGILSGGAMTTGNHNTIIGARVANTTLTTGSRNILIGTDNNCDTAAAATNDNFQICASTGAVPLISGSLVAATTTPVTFNSPIQIAAAAKTVVGSLPTCNAAAEGTWMEVTDAAAAPVYNATVAAGGAVHIPVFCNGTNWTNH